MQSGPTTTYWFIWEKVCRDIYIFANKYRNVFIDTKINH